MHGTDPRGHTAIEPALRAPLILSTLTIDPATRQLVGPSGTTTLRPQVMRVLLALADAGGAVVPRDEVAEQAWEKRFVAEDSLNGAISEIRRALRQVGATHVGLLTIPKTGYRLVVDEPGAADNPERASDAMPELPAARTLQRRAVIAGGAGAAVLAGAALWRWREARGSTETTQLIERGIVSLRHGLPEYHAQGVAAFRRASELEPENARAWGLLAVALRAAGEYGTPEQATEAGRQSELAARRALAIDPRQSDALAALALLTPSFGAWLEAEQRLREVLAIDPGNPFAQSGLSRIFMSTGRARASLASLEQQIANAPLSPNLQFRRGYTLWSLGRETEADATLDRALQSWPRHPAVWFARFYTFAFTDRVPRAQAMLADTAQRPPMPAPAANLLGLSLTALARPTSPMAARAIEANLAAAAKGPAQAVSAIMILSALGAAAQSLEVARGFLLQRGDVLVRQRHSAQQPSVTDQHHRMTMMLWTPASRALRAQRGFLPFCEEIGFASYWRETGIGPDFPIGPAE